jgi:predicted ester cyclase
MDVAQLLKDQFEAVATGDRALAAASIHPAFVNHMAVEEPPACSIPGPPGLMATSAWLRLAVSELRFEIIDLVEDGERAVAHVWMKGRQTGPFVFYPPGQRPVSLPPTRREFAVRQCHLYRLEDELLIEHIAVRDDLGMMTQLQHLPPTPAAMVRVMRWRLTGAHSRAVAAATAVAQEAAESMPRTGALTR